MVTRFVKLQKKEINTNRIELMIQVTIIYNSLIIAVYKQVFGFFNNSLISVLFFLLNKVSSFKWGVNKEILHLV